ncbi:DUF1566 domain-containing protein [Rhodopseudomonas palustris]|nr:DUF1566 domain-containing protein [Rhodopseudomonas palustris]
MKLTAWLQLPVIRQVARYLIFVFILIFVMVFFTAIAAVPSFAALNDTGITTCSNETENWLPCPVDGFPRQDAEYGRDAQAQTGTLIKIGGGEAGFDFTKISNTGAVLSADAQLGSGAADWACTRDNVTGLMWEVKTDDGGLRDQNKTYIFSLTADYVMGINSTSLCGFNDWRMPTVKELLEITHHGRSNPAVDINYFPNTQTSWFWSGYPDLDDSNAAWVVGFHYGVTKSIYRSFECPIRLVRGGAFFNSFSDNGNGTVTQTNTGLMWAKCAEGQRDTNCSGNAIKVPWSYSLSVAENSRLAGYADWRLPNIKELRTLVDYGRSNPAIDTRYFPNTPSSWFWSISPGNSYSYYGTYANFADGTTGQYNRSDDGYIRLVRDITSSLNVTVTGAGSVASNPAGIACGGDCAEDYLSNQQVILIATPTGTATFIGWTGACTGNEPTCAVSMDQARAVTAEFSAAPSTYALSVTVAGTGNVSGTGINCPGDCNETYNSGTQVILTAAATGANQFTGWGGACSGNLTTCTVTMDAIKSVTANFQTTAPTYLLTVNKFGNGTVASSTVDINCGTDCTENYTSGTQVTLTAVANSDSRFVNWTGACSGILTTCTVTMNAAKTVTANFELQSNSSQQTLTVNAYGPGAVNSNPSGIACGSVCSKTFNSGAQVVLTAMPLTGGAVFSRWDGCPNENGLTCTVTMNEAQNVTATFRYPTSMTQLIVSVLGEGQVISNPSGVNCDTALCFGGFTAGTEMKLTAQPETGWQFKEWQRGGACGGETTAECQFTLNQTQTAIAVFEEAASVNQHELQAIIVGAGNITSQPSGSGIDCGRADNDAELTGTCVTNYTADQVVIFTATAEENAQFTSWGGVCADQGDTPICTVIIAELIASGENSSSIIASFGAIDRSNTTRWKVAELYMATMGYAMDAEGLNYWVNNIESGQLDSEGQPWTIDTVAQAFFNVDLVQAKYPTTLSNSEFIDEIYRNIFGRGADVDGRNYWLTELSERGTPRNAMIITVINGGWGNTSADAQSDMLRFKYRTEVALAFADYQSEHGIVYGALDAMNQQYLIAAGSNVLANVTQDETTRDAAIANIPNLLAPLHD